MDAPEGSLINPEIVPRSDCANSIPEARRLARNTKMLVRHAFFMMSSVAEMSPAGNRLKTQSPVSNQNNGPARNRTHVFHDDCYAGQLGSATVSSNTGEANYASRASAQT